MMKKLSSEDLNFCAHPENLPVLRDRWNTAMHSADRTPNADRACLMLETALWYHKEKLISALDRQSKLRLVHG